jgi:malic enzyme
MERYPVRRRDDGKEEVELPLRGARLLTHNLYNHGTAFTREQRRALGLSGLLPHEVRSIETQAEHAYEHIIEEADTSIEKYLGLADLEARNVTLYYRVLLDHLEEFLPVVYTPTVGEACQLYSHIFRRGRGLWITPNHRGRIAEVLRNAPYDDVRLIVVTDNERILGLGDQGAGGMGIPVGKLDLYTVAAGIHPTRTLPISLDVGTDNPELLNDPGYIGWREPRLRGEPYDALVEEFVEAVQHVFPRALLQWEDFKKANAFRLLDRYRERILSFNDDIEGTAAIALAGILAASRITGVPLERQRILMLGAGAAGVGIARLVRSELRRRGVEGQDLQRAIALLDSNGLLVEGRDIADAHKLDFVWSHELAVAHGLDPDETHHLLACVEAIQPTVLIGTSGQPGVFTEEVVRAMAAHASCPAIFPFSNPNSKSEAHPRDLVKWTNGQVLVATGSPFRPVDYAGYWIPVAQGNNVYVFPGVGLGALASGATRVVDEMFAAAAHAVSEAVSDDAIARGELYPPISGLRGVARAVALAVAKAAVEAGVAPQQDDAALAREVDALIWEPVYPEVVLPER